MMHTHANKDQQAQTVAVPTRATDGPGSRFRDLVPQTTLQRKWQTMADNSPQVQQLKGWQSLADQALQRKGKLEEEELLQGKFETLQRKPNNTGLPDHLKSGIENLSGMAMDDVRVHYNSAKPSQLQAHAYAQGTDIHVAPGQEKHLPHEAWHVVQQMQGRVQPTLQLNGQSINDDKGLEKEADEMGNLVIQSKRMDNSVGLADEDKNHAPCNCLQKKSLEQGIIQRQDDPCYVPDWANPPYGNLKNWEQQNVNIGPNLAFSNAQVDQIYALNRATHNPGNYIKVTIPNSTDVQTSDGDNSLLVRHRQLTFATANVDHVVEKSQGGCASVLNAQVLSEAANVGATYMGGKWIYDAANDTYYNPTAYNKNKFNLP